MASNQYPQQPNVVFVHPSPPPPYQESTTTSITTTYNQAPPPPQYPAYPPAYPTPVQPTFTPLYPTLPAQPVVAQQSHCVTRVTRPAPGVKVVNHQYYNTPAQTHVIVAPQQKRGLFSRSLNTIENKLDSALGSFRHPAPATNKTVIVTQKNGTGSTTTVIRRY